MNVPHPWPRGTVNPQSKPWRALDGPNILKPQRGTPKQTIYLKPSAKFIPVAM